MSVSVTVAGTAFTIPQNREKGWGTNVTTWIQKISNSSLQLNLATTKWDALSKPIINQTGTATNDSAASGVIGEFQDPGPQASALSGTGQWTDIGFQALTAGDWEVTMSFSFQAAGATFSTGSIQYGISTTAGNNAPSVGEGSDNFETLAPTANYDTSAFIPAYRYSLAAPATVYMKVKAVYTVANPQCHGRIKCRRIR